MPPRLLYTTHTLPDVGLVELLTQKLTDESYVGAWSRVSDSMYIFADHNMGGRAVTHHGGPIAGAAGGTPVQLVFWGEWWSGSGAGMRIAIEAQTRRLLASRYFSELAQYGVASPIWRGSTIVRKPAAPRSTNAAAAIRATLDLIDDLIDDDVFPDPDDGPRIAFIVVMPDGFAVSDALGSHWYDYDFDGPFDADNYWAGWAQIADPIGAPPDETVMTIAHELAEIMTDPEGDGWHSDDRTNPNEIVDAGQSPSAGHSAYDPNAYDQSAYVNGVKVQAYWSNRHKRTIIPVNDGYRAQLRATIHELSRSPLESGVFKAEPGGLADCIGDDEFWWRTALLTERIRVRFNFEGFHTPAPTGWSINGQRLSATTGSISLNVVARGYSGIEAADVHTTATVQYTAVTGGLDLQVSGAKGGFSLAIGCSITDFATTGRLQSQPTASPRIEVGVRGVDLEVDPEYGKRLARCLREFIRPWLEVHLPTGRPRPGDPPNFDVSVIRERQIAATSQREWQLARDVAVGITAAYATLDRDDARTYAVGLLQALPSVNGLLSIDDIERGFIQPRTSIDRPAAD